MWAYIYCIHRKELSDSLELEDKENKGVKDDFQVSGMTSKWMGVSFERDETSGKSKWDGSRSILLPWSYQMESL